MIEGDLLTARERLINLEKQFRKLEQEKNIINNKYTEVENNNKNILREKDQINIQYNTLLTQFRTMEQQKLRIENIK